MNECGGCRFFHRTGRGTLSYWRDALPHEIDQDVGLCRRFPPQVTDSSTDDPRQRFPQVSEHAWCGEWQLEPNRKR